jgi:hypothetical protein
MAQEATKYESLRLIHEQFAEQLRRVNAGAEVPSAMDDIREGLLRNQDAHKKVIVEGVDKCGELAKLAIKARAPIDGLTVPHMGKLLEAQEALKPLRAEFKERAGKINVAANRLSSDRPLRETTQRVLRELAVFFEEV